MASPTQIILILACVYITECRLRGKINKEHISLNEHKIQEKNENVVTERPVVPTIKTNEDLPAAKARRDEDAIVFPKDQDTRVYLDLNKIIKDTFNKIRVGNDKSNKAASATYVPLLPKVVPALEAKEAFTNPIILKDEEVTHKSKDGKDNIQTSSKLIIELEETKVEIDAVTEDNLNITLDNNIAISVTNDASNSNETVPDFSSRFGVTGNYVIAPANDVQRYQAVQIPNDLQGNIQQYGIYSGQGNTIDPNITTQFTTPNGNINNPNAQYIQNTNILQNSYVPNSNVNYNGIPQGTVPISIGNTYMINGQLYAAITVPNNVNVPNSVYLINSQQEGSGQQVNNNLPVYKLVSIGQGDQGKVNQYVPINRNGNNQYVLINGNGNNQYVPINGNENNQYVPIAINGNGNNQYVPINGNGNNQYVPIYGNGNNQYVPIPINGNGNNQDVPINGNGNNQYILIPTNGNQNGNQNNQQVPINGYGNNQQVPINGYGNNQYALIPTKENGNIQQVGVNRND